MISSTTSTVKYISVRQISDTIGVLLLVAAMATATTTTTTELSNEDLRRHSAAERSLRQTDSS
jgi:hypothetical protein